MAAANIVVDKHSPDEFDKLSLPENLEDNTGIQQGRTYFLAGSVLGTIFILRKGVFTYDIRFLGR